MRTLSEKGQISQAVSRDGFGVNRSPSDILAIAQAGRFVVEDFRPLAESLEWELSQLYFAERGSNAFVNSQEYVPFEINNNGNLSQSAAETLFANLVEAETSGALEPYINVLELGIGCGLFARLFLDAFRDLCGRHCKDYYDRMCYIATDRSDQMLSDTERNAIFENHPGRFRLARVDAINLVDDLANAARNGEPIHGTIRAIFANYLLDSLPATVLETDEQGMRELHIRTYLARGVQLQDHTRLTAEQIAACATSTDLGERRKLIDLYPLFALEYEYFPVSCQESSFAEISKLLGSADNHHVLHNHGAIRCIDQAIGLLHKNGFMIINDYGVTEPGASSEEPVHQKFSGSIAIGLNFPLLKLCCESRSVQWVEPDGDNEHIVGRLLGTGLTSATVTRFRQQFGKKRFEQIDQSLVSARMHTEHGLTEKGLDDYCAALELQPYNWSLMNEVAMFLIFGMQNYQAGVEMAQAGLALNPNCSADLWNTLGDGFFCLEQFDEARDAFLRALEIDPNDTRARFNMAEYFMRVNDLPKALKAVTDALLHDKRGEYRERLLQKQAEILGRLATRHEMEQRFLAGRINRRITPNQTPPATNETPTNANQAVPADGHVPTYDPPMSASTNLLT